MINSQINTTVNVHDRYQLELKVLYGLTSNNSNTPYELDLYFFVPQSLDVNSGNYSKKDFFSDLQTRIRLKTPPVSLHQLANSGGDPLQQLRTLCYKIADHPDQITYRKDFVSQIKLFCCFVRSALRDAMLFIQITVHPEDRERLVEQFVNSCKIISSKYRELQAIIQTPGVDSKTLDLFFFGDECISLSIEDYSSHLFELCSTSIISVSEQSLELLQQLISEQFSYRSSRGYPSIPDQETDNESLIYRKGILKKFISSVLFLDTEIKKSGQLLEQTIFGISAGVAMLFATAAAFITQSIYGSLTLPVFLALVISYIFKDRIKDLLRYYLSRKITRYLFDHETRIHDSRGRVVGKCKESFEFVPESRVPPEIYQLRDRQHLTEIENGWMGEQIFLYRKRVRLIPRRVQNIFQDSYVIDGIHDILRYNIQQFLRKMDDPAKTLFVVDEEFLKPVKGDRVYHLNLILKQKCADQICCSRYRVVLNRRGIKRIEEVFPPESISSVR